MKKTDESNNQSQEGSSLVIHGLRRFSVRQGTSNNSLNCKGIEVSGTSKSLYQNGEVLDSWHNAEDDVSATPFWNHDDMERTRNDISLLKSVVTNSYTGMTPGSSMNSSEVNHSRADGTTSQRLQKFVPCGYAPNRFPVTLTSIPRSCWPKTCYGDPAHTFSGTITLPSTRIVPASSSTTQSVPSTSGLGTLSANEQIIYPKSPSTSNSGPRNKSQTLLVGLLRRINNGTSTSSVLEAEHKKISKIDLGSEFFYRKLSFPKYSAVKECTSADSRKSQKEKLDKKGAVEGANSRRDTLLIWSVSKDKEAENIRNKSSKSFLSRGKPHMPKFLQSFCCCIRSETAIKAKRRILHSVPSTSTPQSLITQVTKNSQNGTNINGTSVSVNDSYSADSYNDTREYVPMVNNGFFNIYMTELNIITVLYVRPYVSACMMWVSITYGTYGLFRSTVPESLPFSFTVWTEAISWGTSSVGQE
uniref:Uncharacterized protein n=1 Tax=Loa loa TaxID=7209 RepID=A0A1I7VYF3_LOALO